MSKPDVIIVTSAQDAPCDTSMYLLSIWPSESKNIKKITKSVTQIKDTSKKKHENKLNQLMHTWPE